MKKITEAELSKRVNSLREKLVLESNSEVDEAWYDPSSWGKPDYKATDAVKGKNGQRNYNAALAQIKSLYAAAGVAYPPQDKIVQQRFGLPDPLPATAAEWDGTMPNAGQADYLTRNVFGRDASAKAGDVNTANNAASVKQAAHDTLVDSKVAELKKTVNSLLALIGTRDAKTGGAVTTGPMEETMRRLRNLIAEAEAPIQARPSVTPLPAPTAPSEPYNAAKDSQAANPSDKAGLIKQCQALMAELNSLEENPDQDVIEALQNAQAAIDQAAKTPDPAPTPTPGADHGTPYDDEGNMMPGWSKDENNNPVWVGDQDGKTFVEPATQALANQARQKVPAAPGDPAQDAQGNHIPISSTQTVTPDATAPQGFGQAFRAARDLQMKKDPKNPGGGIFTWNGKQYNTQQKDDAGGAPAAPAKQDIEPSQFTNVPYPPTPRPMNVKPLPGRVQEAVNYADDQTLARIVSLGRR